MKEYSHCSRIDEQLLTFLCFGLNSARRSYLTAV